MFSKMPATLVKNKFGEVIRNVYTSGDPIVVEKDGIPVVAIIPLSKFKMQEYRPAGSPFSPDLVNQCEEDPLRRV